MGSENRQFVISFPERGEGERIVIEKDAILIGRLPSCDLVLEHRAVSRIHAGINLLDSKYFLINLSAASALTLNGRRLNPQDTDVVADGDIIQIGPFLLTIRQEELEMEVAVERPLPGKSVVTTRKLPPLDAVVPDRVKKEQADVLKVFWQKRTREKQDWGSRLRPTRKPQPGKAVINWKPTADLRRPWRVGLFIWSAIVIGSLAAFAYMRYPETYAPKPLSAAHAQGIDNSPIARAANGNSCMTCHVPNKPIENSCVACHRAEEFHVSNTKAHQEAGITCTTCHKEHTGSDFNLTASAIQSCAQCHNDSNQNLYNGKAVGTPHGGGPGYPIEAGIWKWKGVYKEIADSIPEINSSATGDANEQARVSRHFHSIHVARLKTPPGMEGSASGFVSCSTCHKSFDPIDRETPKQTCVACHTTRAGSITADARFAPDQVNCISCHAQHPYSARRWSEFLSEGALGRRKEAIAAHIKSLNNR
jgi:predicted CXXCH cytochrome family protein